MRKFFANTKLWITVGVLTISLCGSFGVAHAAYYSQLDDTVQASSGGYHAYFLSGTSGNLVELGNGEQIGHLYVKVTFYEGAPATVHGRVYNNVSQIGSDVIIDTSGYGNGTFILDFDFGLLSFTQNGGATLFDVYSNYGSQTQHFKPWGSNSCENNYTCYFELYTNASWEISKPVFCPI